MFQSEILDNELYDKLMASTETPSTNFQDYVSIFDFSDYLETQYDRTIIYGVAWDMVEKIYRHENTFPVEYFEVFERARMYYSGWRGWIRRFFNALKELW